MPAIPRRLTLVHQLTAIVRQEIAAGTWKDWLPSERSLSERLQVSRNTLRKALEQLERQGVIRLMHGAGNRILVPPTTGEGAGASREIAVLSPDPLPQLRPSLALCIDQLRILLAPRGYLLRVVHGRQYFRPNPGPILHRLLRQHHYACWVLLLANEPVQRWFAASGVKCVVAGTVYEGVDLPFCAADHRAMCGHVARRMLDLGHRKVALLIRHSGLAADRESAAGFEDAVRAFPGRNAEATICHHHDSVAGICEHVRRLMRRPAPPTALLVTNAHYYLTVTSCLQSLGKKIRDDVSVVSRTDDRFLDFMSPQPARYTVSAEAMGRGLSRLILNRLHGRARVRSVHILPRFSPGESLGRRLT